MSRRDRNDPQLRKKTRNEDPEQEQEEAQEQAVETERQQEQARDAAQDQIGNQGIAAMLGVASVKPGEAGLGIDAMLNREEESASLQFGGEEPPPDGPLTLDDLVRSWNPTTRKGQDTPDKALGLYQALPEEDEALLALAREGSSIRALPSSTAIDALLQPGPEALLEDVSPVVRAAVRLGEPTLLIRALGRLAAPAASLLSDPYGRLLHMRARTCTLAALLAAQALERGPRMASPPALFLLDLAARGRSIDEALDEVRASEVRLPMCRAVLEALLSRVEGARGSPVLRAAGPSLANHLGQTLWELLALPDPNTLVPSLPEAPLPGEDDDDPLGIDGTLAAALGPAQDPLSGIYDAQLQSAERLAGAAARLRTHAAGMLLAVALSAAPWSAGIPEEALLQVASEIDRAAGENLALLVEIGRAIQRRAVPPPGVRNGLRRVARGLGQLQLQIPQWVVPIVAGLLPQGEDLPPPSAEASDPLAFAWADLDPSRALPWLRSLGGSLDHRITIAATRASAGELGALAPEWVSLARESHESGRGPLSAALSMCACAALVHAGDDEAALAQAKRDMGEALARRNGIWLAASAIVALDVLSLRGEREAAQELRVDTARILYRMSARAGLSALARWREPGEEDLDEGYTYPYPEEAEAPG